MATNTQRWCHACGKLEDFGQGWFELWIGTEGECLVQPVDNPSEYDKQFRSEIFACGQLSALVLVERYLHTRTFDPASAPAAAPSIAPTSEPDYTAAQLAYELNSTADYR